MNILILGTSILAINPQDTGDQWETADQIIPKHVAQGAVIVDATLPDDYAPGRYNYVNGSFVMAPLAADVLADLKAKKNADINRWRAEANSSTFTHLGKVIACDMLSRSDIDGVAGSISLTGAFPVGFPGAWKAADNTYIMMPTIDDFKAMYASMTAKGAENFAHSQALKAALALAETRADFEAIVW